MQPTYAEEDKNTDTRAHQCTLTSAYIYAHTQQMMRGADEGGLPTISPNSVEDTNCCLRQSVFASVAQVPCADMFLLVAYSANEC